MLSFMDGSLALCSFASFAHPSPYITQIVSKLLESWNLMKVIMTLTLKLIDVQSCWEFGRSNRAEKFGEFLSVIGLYHMYLFIFLSCDMYISHKYLSSKGLICFIQATS